MDNWNNEQKSDMSVSGQFSGATYEEHNTNDQNPYGQPTNGAGGSEQSADNTGAYNQPLSGYNQPMSGNSSYYGNQSGAGNYTQTQNNAAGGYANQPNGNNAYGQQSNNYANGYGQPFANYNQPSYQAPGFLPTEMEEPVGVGEWTGLLAIASFVPCIGLILLLVWGFGGTDKKSKSNFCKAYLIIMLIKVALYALMFIIWGTAFASVIDSF